MTRLEPLGDLEGLRLGGGDALFLDFDGTLADIGPDPDAVRLDARTEAALTRMAAALGGAVVVLSGRDLRDLAGRVPAALWRAGQHGLETVAPGETPRAAPPPPPEAVRAPLEAVARPNGLRLEFKGPVAALHFRSDPALEGACLAAAEDAAAAGEDYVVMPGKMVVEVKPRAANKGRAVRALAARAPFAGRRLVMLGDDRTDEDAIAAAQALGGVGVKVGAGETAASLRTPAPEAVRAWLAREAG
jgi:trehalose 6-phosphate phosphatase